MGALAGFIILGWIIDGKLDELIDVLRGIRDNTEDL